MKAAQMVNDDVDELDVEAEFHAEVKAITAETLELFKDNKYVRKLLKKGKFEKLIEYVELAWNLEPDLDSFDIVNATEQEDGLQKLAVDAAFGQQLQSLALQWGEVAAAKSIMTSLTWPVVKV